MNSEKDVVPMKQVYQLSQVLFRDPELVTKTQDLTLNRMKPNSGLKGSHGLFGSSEWWANIEAGVISSKRLSGVIKRVYVAGQDQSDVPNAFDLSSSDGQIRMEGIYVNSSEYVALYQVGRKVDIVYVLDDLKMPLPDGAKNYLEIVIEVFVSLQ